MSNDSTEPLLREDRRAMASAAHDYIHLIKPSSPNYEIRHQIQRFLTSKTGHYSVLLLVAADVSCIFADFLISLLKCEQKSADHGWDIAQDVLGIVSLVFSCLFMAELLAAVFAFGLAYFKSWFHCFDAAVIILGFVVDVLLHGVLEEVASLVVILRLWRVFKIVEEFSAGAQEQMEEMAGRIEKLESENKELKKEVDGLKKSNGMDGHAN
ncbi:MAG: hypothetical protein M1827_005470 [Pycnora praestabilis]|nr:MAG: hypothetical protein M1827_005470 [Pycnora praestabilis]